MDLEEVLMILVVDLISAALAAAEVVMVTEQAGEGVHLVDQDMALAVGAEDTGVERGKFIN